MLMAKQSEFDSLKHTLARSEQGHSEVLSNILESLESATLTNEILFKKKEIADKKRENIKKVIRSKCDEIKDLKLAQFSIEEEIDLLKGKNISQESKLKSIKAENSDLKSEIQIYQERADVESQLVFSHMAEVKLAKEHNDALTLELNESSRQIVMLKDIEKSSGHKDQIIKEKESGISQLKTRIKDQQVELNNMNTRYVNLKNDNIRLSLEHNQLQDELATQVLKIQKVSKLESELETKAKRISSLQKSLEAENLTCVDLKAKCLKFQEQNQTQSSLLFAAEMAKADLQSQFSTIEKLNMSNQALSTQNQKLQEKLSSNDYIIEKLTSNIKVCSANTGFKCIYTKSKGRLCRRD
jgi:predicted RNase H-like nuclease (RuvC/YqgF family)